MSNMKSLILANTLHGFEVEAEDGPSGRIDDFYFNDQTWNIIHVAVDVGGWLTEHKVLLSPEVFGHFDWRKKHSMVKLTRKQVNESPDADTMLPGTSQMQRQADLFLMQGMMVPDGYLGMYRSVEPPPVRADEKPDPHFRSTRTLKDCPIVTRERKSIGRIQDFLIDTERWEIRFLALKTDDGRIFLVQPDIVESIDPGNTMVAITHPEEIPIEWQEYDPHYMALLEIAKP